MKIGIVADLHGYLDPELLEWIELTKVEALLQLGDYGLYTYDKFPVPVFWVYGNRESPDTMWYTILNKVIPNNYQLPDNIMLTLGGINILGINGAEFPKNDGYMTTFIFEEMEKHIKLRANKIDILITHEPVVHKIDTSIFDGKIYETDNKTLRKLTKILKPKYVFSGHSHFNAYEKIDNTDAYILGITKNDWLIFDTEKYLNGEYPIDNIKTLLSKEHNIS